MFGLLRTADNVMVAIVESTDGYDLSGYTVVTDLPADFADRRWNPSTSQWDARPTNESEDLGADPFWTALRTATPNQIENWLTNNVTNLTEARRVLKLILLALRALHARKTL